jgi:hypothetical protein
LASIDASGNRASDFLQAEMACVSGQRVFTLIPREVGGILILSVFFSASGSLQTHQSQYGNILKIGPVTNSNDYLNLA